MRTRSGKTYFAEGEERCPVCLDSSWATVGETRLLCVEGCGCPVPTTHAHCYLAMTATCDVAGDGKRMTRCPGCTHEVSEPMAVVMRKAQFNHDVLRKRDPTYSTEKSVMLHAIVSGSRNMIASAKRYDRETRRVALDMARDQGRMLALVDAVSYGIDSGWSADLVKSGLHSLRSMVLRGLVENVRRMSSDDVFEQEMRRRESEARVFLDTGL